MESLIIFIVMLVLGSLFNGNKKKQQNEQRKGPKPFTANQERPSASDDSPIRKLREMSKEFLDDIQKEFEVEQEKPAAKPVAKPTVVQTPVVRPQQKETSDRPVNVAQADLPTHEHKSRRELYRQKTVTRLDEIKSSENNQEAIIPTTHDEIMKGIIFSEIIGPPKSKR